MTHVSCLGGISSTLTPEYSVLPNPEPFPPFPGVAGCLAEDYAIIWRDKPVLLRMLLHHKSSSNAATTTTVTVQPDTAQQQINKKQTNDIPFCPYRV